MKLFFCTLLFVIYHTQITFADENNKSKCPIFDPKIEKVYDAFKVNEFKKAYQILKPCNHPQSGGRFQWMLGNLYVEGLGTEKSFKKGCDLFENCAKNGHSNCQLSLGICYANGQGKIKDPVQAHMWFNISASQGYKESEKTAKNNLKLLEKNMSLKSKEEAYSKARKCIDNVLIKLTNHWYGKKDQNYEC